MTLTSIVDSDFHISVFLFFRRRNTDQKYNLEFPTDKRDRAEATEHARNQQYN